MEDHPNYYEDEDEKRDCKSWLKLICLVNGICCWLCCSTIKNRCRRRLPQCNEWKPTKESKGTLHDLEDLITTNFTYFQRKETAETPNAPQAENVTPNESNTSLKDIPGVGKLSEKDIKSIKQEMRGVPSSPNAIPNAIPMIHVNLIPSAAMPDIPHTEYTTSDSGTVFQNTVPRDCISLTSSLLPYITPYGSELYPSDGELYDRCN